MNLPIESPLTLGTALKTARKQLQLTQSDLALTAGVGLRFIVDLEAGKPSLQLSKVLQVIEALGMQLQLSECPPFVNHQDVADENR